MNRNRLAVYVLLVVLALGLSAGETAHSNRKWFMFPFRLPKPPFRIEPFWLDIPKHAKNFFDKLIPRSLRNLFNFDPSPDWVPHERQFYEDEGFLRDESIPELNDTIADADEEDDGKQFEKGNLHGFGRDVIRQISYQFSNSTAGLDTDKNFFNGLLNGFKEQVRAIFPGTQWCGDGNRARYADELGLFFKTDSCCRDHDACSDYIVKDEMKYGLYNKGLFTRSHCDCDGQFYECLKEADDMISSQIGAAYFSALGPQCFKLEYPIIDCKIRLGLTHRCVEYEFDNSTKMVYQWFDNPEF